jgi:hypothetical protein
MTNWVDFIDDPKVDFIDDDNWRTEGTIALRRGGGGNGKMMM